MNTIIQALVLAARVACYQDVQAAQAEVCVGEAPDSVECTSSQENQVALYCSNHYEEYVK